MTTEATQQPADGRDGPNDSWSGLRRGSRWVARVLICLAVAIAVVWKGGVSVAAVTAVAAVVGLAWFASLPAVPHRRPVLLGPWLLAALGAWTALHTVALPRAVVAALHPAALQLSDEAHRAAGLPIATSLPIATAPGDAALQAALYLIAFAVATLAANAMMGSGGRVLVRWLVVAMVGSAIGAALLLSVEIDVIPAQLLGPLGAPAKDLAIVNPNHTAGILNLALAVAIGVAVHAGSGSRQVALGVASLVIAVASLATGSRGGAVVMLVVILGTIASTPPPPRHMRVEPTRLQSMARWRAALMTACVILAGAATATPVLEREFFGTADLGRDAKLQFLSMLPDVVRAAPLLGWAPGGVPVALAQRPEVTVRHDFAENLIAERLLDDGPIAAIALFAAAAWVILRSVRRTDRVFEAKPFQVAAVTFLAANLVDFSFEIAGGIIPFACTIALGEHFHKQSAREREKAEHHRRAFHARTMAAVGVALGVAGWLLVVAVPGRMTRDIDQRFEGATVAEASALASGLFAYDAHAQYLAARVALAARRTDVAQRWLDRAVALRPSGEQARLFRFAVRLENGDFPGAGADMHWLLDRGGESAQRALAVCAGSPRAEGVLVDLLPRIPDRAMEIMTVFEQSRPDIVERVAVDLRKRYPDRRFATEAQRARVYIARNAIAPARLIAAELMARPETLLDGYHVEGLILAHQAKLYPAFHLFKTVCAARPSSPACGQAAWTILGAGRPEVALEYLRAMPPGLRASPGKASLWWRWIASAHLQLGAWDEALEAARSAHNLQPKDKDTGMLLAECLFRTHLFGELTDLSEQLRREFPRDPDVIALAQRVHAAAQPLSLRAPAAQMAPLEVTPASLASPASVDTAVPHR